MFLNNQLNIWHISCLTLSPRTPLPEGSSGDRHRPGAAPPPPGAAGVPAWRRARRRFWWLLLLLLAAVAGRLPVGAGRRAGRLVARLGLRLRPRERRQAAANLALAFPDRDGPDRDRLLRQAALAAGSNLFDALAAGRLLGARGLVLDEPDEAGRSLVDLVLAEAAAGRGVLVLSGHLGCWELMGAWLARGLADAGGPPLHVVTGTVRNPAVDRWLSGRRRALGLRLLPRGEGVAPLLRCLRAGGVAAVLVDQNTDVDSVPVPFFGRPAPTPTGAARLAVSLNVPVVVATIARTVDGRGHRVWHGPVWRADPARAREPQIAACLGWTNGLIEERVRRNPAEWVWYHRRWNDGAPARGGKAEV
jgi:KDO2-lipid IV(A) lauroyltransferase